MQVYGMLMARSTYEGMKMANSNKRPFVLTRAGFIGSQRYAATWTGDNLSNWEHLHMSLSMVLQLVGSYFDITGLYSLKGYKNIEIMYLCRRVTIITEQLKMSLRTCTF